MPATIKRVHILLYGTFRRAKAQRQVLYNVMENVHHIAVKRNDVEVFTAKRVAYGYQSYRNQ